MIIFIFLNGCGLIGTIKPYLTLPIDHFTRCKQHWSRSTSCFSFL